MRISMLGGVLLMVLASSADAKVYKWVDAHGGIHYSTHAPAQADAREVRVTPAPPAAADARPAAAEKQPDAKQPDPAQAAADADRIRALKKNCEIAQQNLKILQDPSNRRFSDDKEGPVYYTDEQRAARIADTQKSIQTYCGESGR